MDIVYALRDRAPEVEALRFSLRSCARFLRGLGQVWIVSGSAPPFRVCWLPFPDATPNRHTNTGLKALAAATHPEVSDPFLFMNADFIALQPIDLAEFRSPATNTLEPLRGKMSPYRAAVLRTIQYVQQVRPGRPVLLFDIHTPLLIEKTRLIQVLREHPWAASREEFGMMWRTLYGNLADIPAEIYASDVKLYQPGPPKPYAWLSFTLGVFQQLLPWLEMMFPEATPWE